MVASCDARASRLLCTRFLLSNTGYSSFDTGLTILLQTLAPLAWTRVHTIEPHDVSACY